MCVWLLKNARGQSCDESARADFVIRSSKFDVFAFQQILASSAAAKGLGLDYLFGQLVGRQACCCKCLKQELSSLGHFCALHIISFRSCG